jgi:small neutral amino acid transporter SnatA (MarC family)
MPLALYPITAWISGVAKSAETDRRGLSTVSVWVFLEIMWCLLLGALVTHCWSEYNYIHVFLVAGGIIVFLMAMWGFTFNRPAVKILLRLFLLV